MTFANAASSTLTQIRRLGYTFSVARRHLRRANAARDSRRWGSASFYYGKYLALNPDDFAIWVQRGHAEKEAGDMAGAERSYATALALNPSDADLWLQVGHFHKLRHEFERAQDAYRKCLQLDPANRDAERELRTSRSRSPSRSDFCGPNLRATIGEAARQGLGAEADQSTGPAAQQASIRLHIDRPLVHGGVVEEPIGALISITGWAVARAGIESVTVLLGEKSVSQASLGIRREDIAALFPDWPGSYMCGFGLALPRRTFTSGRHTLRVVARDKLGGAAEMRFVIVVDPSAQEISAEALRHFMPQAEIQVKQNLIGRADGRPGFTVCLRLRSADSAEVDKAKTTLDSLQEQYGVDWNLVFIAPGPASVADRLLAMAKPLPAKRVCLIDAAADDALASVSSPPEDPPLRSFFLLLQAGDRLGAEALLEFSLQAAVTPDGDLLYSDERRFDPAAGGVSAFLKPDWSPDLLLSTNYIGRAWCAARALLERSGFTVKDLQARGEYDLVLRLSETARRIVHVPLVLCERGEALIDTPEQERAALHNAMDRRSIAGQIGEGCIDGVYRLQRDIARSGLVSIIIPTMAARGLIKVCLESIRSQTDYPRYEIICIDNIPAAETEWKLWLRENADKVVVLDEPFNWSRFNNKGAEAAAGEFFLFLNDDIEVLAPDWLDALVEHAQRDEVGVVGPQLLYPDGKVQHAGLFLAAVGGRHIFRFLGGDEPGPFGLARTQRDMTAVTGACMMMSRRAFEAAGGFDEAHAVINNDLDYCLRVQQRGGRVIYTPHARLIHHELASRAMMKDEFDTAAFSQRWGGAFRLGDPFLHPALSVDDDNPPVEPEPTRSIYAGRPLLAHDRIRNILAVKVDHIGDFITLLPALRHLKAGFPDANLYVLAAKASIALAGLEPSITGVIELDYFHEVSDRGPRAFGAVEQARLEDRLRPFRFDLAVDFRKHTETRFLLRHTGAKVLAGFDRDDQFPWLDVAVQWEGDTPLSAKRSHIADDFTLLAQAVILACQAQTTPPARPLSRFAAIASASARIASAKAPPGLFQRRVVCLHPASGSVMRQWPPVHFAALIDLLVEIEDLNVAIIGAPSDAPVAKQVLDAVRFPDRVWSLVGTTNVGELPTLLAACDLYVGNNSGPQHIAAALGVPTVGIYSGVVDAREWGPLGPFAMALQRDMSCGPCYLVQPNDCHRGRACLWGLTPGQVFRACQQMLLGSQLEPIRTISS
jgi:ADP-heptose:LPS heptosyltransferase/GT2 family glycosyltransferase